MEIANSCHQRLLCWQVITKPDAPDAYSHTISGVCLLSASGSRTNPVAWPWQSRDNGRGEETRRGGDEVTLNKADTVKMRPWKWKSISVSPSSPAMLFSRASECRPQIHGSQPVAINTVFSVGRGRINLSAWTYTDTCSAGHGDPRAMGLEGRKRMKKREREWESEREVRKELKEREGILVQLAALSRTHQGEMERERKRECEWVSGVGGEGGGVFEKQEIL